MPGALAEQQTDALEGSSYGISVRTEEIIVCCPNCKALETLYFDGKKILTSRKFQQQNNEVYHDCGATKPCRVYLYAHM
jgi:hypothetical protein